MQRKMSVGMAATGDGYGMANPPEFRSRSRSMGGQQQPRGHWWSWYEPNTSKAEKWLIFKLDFFILLYTCLTFFIKYLDQTSVTNAWVSGLPEDLHLLKHPNDLNWLTTYYNIGIIVGALFTTFGLTIVPPRYWMPGSTLIMSLFVLFMYKAQNVSTLYALRFCAGLFASGVQPGSYYLIGSWYRRSEIGRRSGIFVCSSLIGSMFSGFIQAGIYRNAGGTDGIAAWRWLFIVDAIIGLPVAIFGFFCCPDEPNAKKMWWMTEAERDLSIERLRTENRDTSGVVLDWGAFRRVLTSWQFYAFPVIYGMRELTCGTEMYRWAALYLSYLTKHKLHHFSTVQINALPTLILVAEVVVIFLAAAAVDWSRRPALVIVIFGLFQVYGYSVLIAYPPNFAFIYSTYVIAGSGYSAVGPIMNAWCNMSCGGDKYLRAIGTAMITVIGYVCETLGQQFFFPVADAPSYHKAGGYVWGVCWTVAYIVACGVGIPLTQRFFAKRALRNKLHVENGNDGENDTGVGSSQAITQEQYAFQDNKVSHA